ncbi:MAG: pyridoxamine 5'-phosphate oxidase family protein [Paludibacteraceae bacterium]|nr:pyridoxamine 5'-phosphate oxidase family protein [Paludibacteraceae bacterium]
MRRKRQELSEEECEKILKKGTSGVLSILGDGGYPYGVPISYVYAEGKLYFHSAVEGHKIDAIEKNDKCSFTVIAQDEIHPDEFTTYFRSVIVFGRIRRLESMDDLVHGLRLLGEKYNPGDSVGLQQEIAKSVALPGGISHTRVAVLCMHIDHLSGKEAIELVRSHKG